MFSKTGFLRRLLYPLQYPGLFSTREKFHPEVNGLKTVYSNPSTKWYQNFHHHRNQAGEKSSRGVQLFRSVPYASSKDSSQNVTVIWKKICIKIQKYRNVIENTLFQRCRAALRRSGPPLRFEHGPPLPCKPYPRNLCHPGPLYRNRVEFRSPKQNGPFQKKLKYKNTVNFQIFLFPFQKSI